MQRNPSQKKEEQGTIPEDRRLDTAEENSIEDEIHSSHSETDDESTNESTSESTTDDENTQTNTQVNAQNEVYEEPYGEPYKTEEDKLVEIIFNDWKELESIPVENRTKRMCEVALQKNLEAIYYVPPNAEFAKEIYIDLVNYHFNSIKLLLHNSKSGVIALLFY